MVPSDKNVQIKNTLKTPLKIKPPPPLRNPFNTNPRQTIFLGRSKHNHYNPPKRRLIFPDLKSPSTNPPRAQRLWKRTPSKKLQSSVYLSSPFNHSRNAIRQTNPLFGINVSRSKEKPKSSVIFRNPLKRVPKSKVKKDNKDVVEISNKNYKHQNKLNNDKIGNKKGISDKMDKNINKTNENSGKMIKKGIKKVVKVIKKVETSVNRPIIRVLNTSKDSLNFLNLKNSAVVENKNKKENLTNKFNSPRLLMTQPDPSPRKKFKEGAISEGTPKCDLKTFLLSQREKQKITCSKTYTVKIPVKKDETSYLVVNWFDFEGSKEIEKPKKIKNDEVDKESIREVNSELYNYEDPFIDDSDLCGLNPNVETVIPGFFAYGGTKIPLKTQKKSSTKDSTEEISLTINFPMEIDFCLFIVNHWLKNKKKESFFESKIDSLLRHLKKQMGKYTNFRDGQIIERELRSFPYKQFEFFGFAKMTKKTKLYPFKELQIKNLFKLWKIEKLNTEKKKQLQLIRKMKNETEFVKNRIAMVIKYDIEILTFEGKFNREKYFSMKLNPCFKQIKEAFKKKEYSNKELDEIFKSKDPKITKKYESVLKGFVFEAKIINTTKNKQKTKRIEIDLTLDKNDSVLERKQNMKRLIGKAISKKLWEKKSLSDKTVNIL